MKRAMRGVCTAALLKPSNPSMKNDLELVDEFLEGLLARRRVLHRDEPVDDEQGGAVALELLAQQRRQRLEPALLQHGEAAQVGERLGHPGGVEEAQGPHVHHHPRVRLRQERDVQGLAAPRDVMEARLVREDGLPRPGMPSTM
jgi:hypothetical protein